MAAKIGSIFSKKKTHFALRFRMFRANGVKIWGSFKHPAAYMAVWGFQDGMKQQDRRRKKRKNTKNEKEKTPNTRKTATILWLSLGAIFNYKTRHFEDVCLLGAHQVTLQHIYIHRSGIIYIYIFFFFLHRLKAKQETRQTLKTQNKKIPQNKTNIETERQKHTL